MAEKSNEELVYLIQEANAEGELDKSKELSDVLLKRVQNLIYRITNGFAKAYDLTTDEKKDLEQEAFGVFVDSIYSYNPTKKACFTTWLFDKLNFGIIDCMRKRDLISVPCKMKRLITQYESIKEVSRKSGKGITDNEILIEMHIDRKKLRQIRLASQAKNVISLYNKDDDGNQIIDKIKNYDYNCSIISVEDEIINKEEKKVINEAIKCLEPIEYKVVYKKFYEEKTFEQISRELGHNGKDYAYRIWERAKQKLLRKPEIKNLRF